MTWDQQIRDQHSQLHKIEHLEDEFPGGGGATLIYLLQTLKKNSTNTFSPPILFPHPIYVKISIKIRTLFKKKYS